jgi:hypothetical protein
MNTTDRFFRSHTALSRAFLILLLIAGIVLTALRIHGSSVVRWSVILNEESTAQSLLYGLPRDVRSDEWLVWTPSLLAQANHIPPFPVENPVLGAGRSPMLLNLPTRHYSTLFRPQLWGYFLFDVEHGFAWNWNLKVFGLLAAMFLLIRKLADGDFWIALLGSLWVFCSSYMQWWFSCPPMLPEMLASWALALWCAMHLLETPPWPRAAVLSLGLVVTTINFALSMYRLTRFRWSISASPCSPDGSGGAARRVSRCDGPRRVGGFRSRASRWPWS